MGNQSTAVVLDFKVFQALLGVCWAYVLRFKVEGRLSCSEICACSLTFPQRAALCFKIRTAPLKP